MAEKQERPSGTVPIEWSGVFTGDWATSPHRPDFELRVDPGMPHDQLVRLLRLVADDVEAR